jgi:cytosine/adenosine deaminase-related metal-dependent hydrolase
MPTVLYTADVLCPMTGPPLEQAGVLVEGERVVAVAEADRLRDDADRVHHTPGVLLPGLVNGHSRVELADAYRLARPGPHHAWVVALARMVASWDAQRWERSAHRGVLELLRGGATATADVVHRGPGVPTAARAGLVGDSFVDVSMVDRREHDTVLAAVERALGLPSAGRRVGIAPGGPHLLGTGVLRALCALAERAGAPLLVPAAASQAEVVALWHADGPLAELARDEGMGFEWLAGGTELTPVRYLAQVGALTRRTTLVHGCWIEDNETALLAGLGVGIVCCPRANALLQAGDAPLERFGQAGVQLALGTDSAAAAPDADLLAEAAAWVELARRRGLAFWPSGVGPIPLEEAALRLATVDGARTLGWGDRSGLLEPGRRADFVVVDVDTTAEAVWRDLIEQGPGRLVLTAIGGVRKARRPDADTPWPPIDHDEPAA